MRATHGAASWLLHEPDVERVDAVIGAAWLAHRPKWAARLGDNPDAAAKVGLAHALATLRGPRNAPLRSLSDSLLQAHAHPEIKSIARATANLRQKYHTPIASLLRALRVDTVEGLNIQNKVALRRIARSMSRDLRLSLLSTLLIPLITHVSRPALLPVVGPLSILVVRAVLSRAYARICDHDPHLDGVEPVPSDYIATQVREVTDEATQTLWLRRALTSGMQHLEWSSVLSELVVLCRSPIPPPDADMPTTVSTSGWDQSPTTSSGKSPVDLSTEAIAASPRTRIGPNAPTIPQPMVEPQKQPQKQAQKQAHQQAHQRAPEQAPGPRRGQAMHRPEKGVHVGVCAFDYDGTVETSVQNAAKAVSECIGAGYALATLTHNPNQSYKACCDKKHKWRDSGFCPDGSTCLVERDMWMNKLRDTVVDGNGDVQGVASGASAKVRDMRTLMRRAGVTRGVLWDDSIENKTAFDLEGIPCLHAMDLRSGVARITDENLSEFVSLTKHGQHSSKLTSDPSTPYPVSVVTSTTPATRRRQERHKQPRRSGGVAATVQSAAKYHPFPVPPSQFAIQFRNASQDAITIYLDNMPPCARTAHRVGECGASSAEDALAWGGTLVLASFSTLTCANDGAWTEKIIPSARTCDLGPGEVWRIVPPTHKGKPFWCTDQLCGLPGARMCKAAGLATGQGFMRTCPGVGAWVTRRGLGMLSMEAVTRFEFNVNGGTVWYNASAVDGINCSSTMTYTGCPIDGTKRCDVPLTDCPYKTTISGVATCPSPKYWPNLDDRCDPIKLDQIRPRTKRNAGHIDDAQIRASYLAGCPPGDPQGKEACHRWWSTDKRCARTWLDFLHKNRHGVCEQYGWAYDEKRMSSEHDMFDHNGNPSDNPISPLHACPIVDGASALNIDIQFVLDQDH